VLFISRKIKETVVINDAIHMTVEAIQGKSVKLSFVCPKDTVILRQEIYHRICQENEAAQLSAHTIKALL